MRRLVKWYHQRSRATRIIVSALAVAVPFYFAAVLSYLVTEVASLGGVRGLILHAVVFIVLLTVIVSFYRYLALLHDEFKRIQSERLSSLLHAYTHMDRLATEKLSKLDARESSFVPTFVAARTDLQRVVEATYATFEAAFGKAPAVAERIDFEVTFMTKSYRDGKLTIPACANREGRSPRSMILREKNADVYEGTVTAMVYRETRPVVHIVEDTSKPEVGYQELYPGQTDRIRSSVVFPVLSHRNELLGTLVVHCDRPGFFKQEDKKYWTDMLEIFSKRLALIKAKLDALEEKRAGSPMFGISLPGPPF